MPEQIVPTEAEFVQALTSKAKAMQHQPHTFGAGVNLAGAAAIAGELLKLAEQYGPEVYTLVKPLLTSGLSLPAVIDTAIGLLSLFKAANPVATS